MASSSQPPPPPPPAISSLPSDIELAKMLRARVVNPSATPAGNNSPIIIHDADVYAQDPADLTRQFEPAVAEDGQEAWYFFTELLPKSQRGKRKRRCMDSGVWHGEGKSKEVVAVHGSDERVAIGHRNLFAFVKKVDGKKEPRTGWIMHEFRLPDANQESHVVLCKVSRSSRRCAPNPPMNNESATAEAQAVEAREAAVDAREAALAALRAQLVAWQARLMPREALQLELAMWRARLAARDAEREALARRDAAYLAVSERNLHELQSNLATREAAVEAREAASAALQAELAAWQAILAAREAELAAREASVLAFQMVLQRFEAREAELAREVQSAAREAEGEALARRYAADLAVSERNLLERERNLAAREAAWESRLQALQEEMAAELEAFVLMNAAIMMAALLVEWVPRAGLLVLPIAIERLS